MSYDDLISAITELETGPDSPIAEWHIEQNVIENVYNLRLKIVTDGLIMLRSTNIIFTAEEIATDKAFIKAKILARIYAMPDLSEMKVVISTPSGKNTATSIVSKPYKQLKDILRSKGV
jgi:hypothetical protein